MLQPVQGNAPVRPAIVRDAEDGLLVHPYVYSGLLGTLPLEDHEGRERIATSADALNYRHSFFVAWLYRKILLFCDRHKHFGIISNVFHEVFLIHVILVVICDAVGDTGLSVHPRDAGL